MTIDPELIHHSWVLICAALVMLMQAGFCCLETGFARAKSGINVAIKNMIDFCISGPLFWFLGFGLMFGTSYHGLVGTTGFAVDGHATPKLLTFILFQLVFCSTATTIVSGAVAERVSFNGYLLLTVFISLVMYPLFGHWAWGGAAEGVPSGWLNKLGFIDFAGSTVVHSLGGWFSLAAALVLGPRLGRFGHDARPMQGHNIPLATLGAMLLWFGWFGFNGGSTLGLTAQIPLILLNTNLAAATGGLGGLGIAYICERRASVGPVLNGVLSGLVGITASCHIASPFCAVLVGLSSGVVGYAAGKLLERWQIDDVVGAVPVHGVCGAWGTLAVAWAAVPENFGTGHDRWMQLGVQALGVVTCGIWSFGVGGLAILAINRLHRLRVTATAERQGLNISEHGANTELIDLLTNMAVHRSRGDFSHPVDVEPHTEVGQIASEYNRVLTRVHQEIAAREETAAALRQAEEKYRSIFENAVEGIFQTTPAGQYLSINPALVRIYGYDSIEDLSGSIGDISRQLYVDPNRRAEFVQRIAETGTVTNFESLIRRKNGEQIWISENARAVRDANGQILHYDGTVEDITERKQLEEWQRQTAAAEAASFAKSQFLARMSHEIRTPLNGVIGMLDLLSGTSLNDKQERYARIARSSAHALLSLINDILDFSKVEAGKLELEHIEFDLASILEDVTEMFSHRADAKGIELACHVLPQVPRRVNGDPERLRQIIVNLMGNALKFTERGSVSLRASLVEEPAAPALIRIDVCDTGLGIPADRVQRLFQPFMQVDASVTRKFGGTGLGLAICKQLIDLMLGRIEVISRPGEGSTFSILIPLHPAAQIAEGAVTIPTDLRGSRVLAVDDHPTNLEILHDQLSSWGFCVTGLRNPLDALPALQAAQAAGNPYRLVILDQQMPELDGLELAAQIKSTLDTSGPRLLMLTSLDNEYGQRDLAALGLHGYITKPIRQSRLFDAIVTAVHGPTQAKRASSIATAPLPHGLTAQGLVLIAEDNEINQIVTAEIIRSAGYQYELVSNGLAAVSAIERATFDAVLMDCEMPELDGFGATARIRTLESEGKTFAKRRTPIIALTANAIAGDRERSLKSGMDDFVTKPIIREDLLGALARAITGSGHATAPLAEPSPNTSTEKSAPQPPVAAARPSAGAASVKPQAAVAQSTAVVSTTSRPIVSDAAAISNQPCATAPAKPAIDLPAAAALRTTECEEDSRGPGPAATSVAIDFDQLAERCLNQPAVIDRVLQMFLRRMPHDLAALRQAAARGDWPELIRVSHGIKGAAANLAADQVRAIASELEACGRLGNGPACINLLPALAQAVDRCCRAIEEFVLEGSGQTAGRGQTLEVTKA